MIAPNTLSRITVSYKVPWREFFIGPIPYVAWLSHRLFSESTPPWKIIFYGNDRFSLETLKMLNENKICSNTGKIVDTLEVVSSVTENPVREYAVSSKIINHSWPYVVPANKFDVGVVVSFGHLIPSKSIRSCRFGMLNAHASLLPRWRGAAPLVHTILSGDKTTGVTILQVSPHKFDTGKILLQESFDVPPHSTSSSLSDFLAPAAAKMILHCLHDLPAFLKYSWSQTEDGITYACKVTPAMGLVEWDSQTCDDIDRLYRAVNDIVKLRTEWCGVQTKLIDMVTLFNPRLTKQIPSCANSTIFPGFCFFSKEFGCICIKCKDGWVGFRKIGLSGKKKFTAHEFHNGYLSKLTPAQCYFGRRSNM